MSIPAFQALSRHDQALLLEESLIDLIIFNEIQQSNCTVNESIAMIMFHLYFMNTNEQQKLSDIIKYIETLQLDQTEFTLLKVLLLFRPGKVSNHNDIK